MKNIYNKRISDGERISALLGIGGVIFTTQDLATIWGLQNRDSLRVLLSRYVARGLLFRVWKGLYSIVDPKTIDPLRIGIQAVHSYCYVSCETVLFSEGVINQKPSEITIVGTHAKRFNILGVQYRVRQMRDTLLYDDTDIVVRNGIRVALAKRAKKDMCYFNPKKYYDANI